MTRLIVMLAIAFIGGASVVARAQPSGYALVFHDEFDKLSLWSAGSAAVAGKGQGIWVEENQEGFGYEWFITKERSGFSPISVANSALTIASGPMPDAAAAAYPEKTRGRSTHFGGALSTFNSFSIAPPFYIETRMKLPDNPAGWAAAWTLGMDKALAAPGDPVPKQWEDDVVESFGGQKTYFVSIHWNDKASQAGVPAPYLSRTFSIDTSIDLARSFNRYGSLVTSTETIWYFNGREVARIRHPDGANANQRQFIVLDLAWGFPWQPTAQYREQATSITIDYVRVYAPTKR